MQVSSDKTIKKSLGSLSFLNALTVVILCVKAFNFYNKCKTLTNFLSDNDAGPTLLMSYPNQLAHTKISSLHLYYPYSR